MHFFLSPRLKKSLSGCKIMSRSALGSAVFQCLPDHIPKEDNKYTFEQWRQRLKLISGLTLKRCRQTNNNNKAWSEWKIFQIDGLIHYWDTLVNIACLSNHSLVARGDLRKDRISWMEIKVASHSLPLTFQNQAGSSLYITSKNKQTKQTSKTTTNKQVI